MARSETEQKTRDEKPEQTQQQDEPEQTQHQDEPEQTQHQDEPEAADDGQGRLSARELPLAAMATVTDLTGLEPEAVTGMEWDGDAWDLTVDVVELARVPNTTDVLACYVVRLDDQGTLLGYKRTRRYLRGQVEAG